MQVCHQQYHVVGKLPAVTELETYLVKYLSKYLCEDIDVARQGIKKFVIEAEKSELFVKLWIRTSERYEKK
jgi:hypothetical protein